MKASAQWIISRSLLYVAITAVGLGAGLLAYHVTSHSPGSGVTNITSPLSWFRSAGILLALIAGSILVILTPLSLFRGRLTNVTLKLILFPFLMVPVVIVDLVGSTTPAIVGVLAIQLCYLTVVRFNRSAASPSPGQRPPRGTCESQTVK